MKHGYNKITIQTRNNQDLRRQKYEKVELQIKMLSCLQGSCLIYVICVCLRIVVCLRLVYGGAQHILCCAFFFFFFGFVCLCLVICVPSVASSSGLSILECPFGFCNVYLRNKSWKPECVLSFNMGWRILVNCIPRLWLGINLEARDKIY